MTAGRWDPRTAGRSRLRASDDDRKRAIDTLQAAFVQGRLSWDDLGTRTGHALAARTVADLAAATAGLPATRAEAHSRRRPRRPRRTGRVEKRNVAWIACLLLMPAALGAALVTYFPGFLILFLLAFFGVTITARL